MSDKIDMTPELTLDPSGASAAAQAPAAPEAPTLTLESSITPEDAAAAQAARDAQAVKLDESQLSESERKMVQRLCREDRHYRLQRGAPVRRGGTEEHRQFLGKCPEQRAHQGLGRGGTGPVLPGGGTQKPSARRRKAAFSASSRRRKTRPWRSKPAMKRQRSMWTRLPLSWRGTRSL